MDEDIETMSTEALKAEVLILRQGIRSRETLYSGTEYKEPVHFMGYVCFLSRTGRNVRALDTIADRLEPLLLNKEYDKVEIVLQECLNRIQTDDGTKSSVYVTVLTTTRPWRNILGSSRDKLLALVKVRLSKECSDPIYLPQIEGLT